MSARRSYPQDVARTAAAHIRALRRWRGLTARELGERCEPPIHFSTILKNESGSRLLTVDELYQLAKALGVSVNMLLTGVCDQCAGQRPDGFVCSLCGSGTISGAQEDHPP